MLELAGIGRSAARISAGQPLEVAPPMLCWPIWINMGSQVICHKPAVTAEQNMTTSADFLALTAEHHCTRRQQSGQNLMAATHTRRVLLLPPLSRLPAWPWPVPAASCVTMKWPEEPDGAGGCCNAVHPFPASMLCHVSSCCKLQPSETGVGGMCRLCRIHSLMLGAMQLTIMSLLVSLLKKQSLWLDWPSAALVSADVQHPVGRIAV